MGSIINNYIMRAGLQVEHRTTGGRGITHNLIYLVRHIQSNLTTY